MRRRLFDDDHEAFRDTVRRFLDAEIAPNHRQWEAAGIVPRAAYAAAGRHGLLAMAAPEEFGGGGIDDFRFNVVLGEEVQRSGLTGFGLGVTLHNDICLPYFLTYANKEQQRRWLPGIASGELITAIAMTEPGIGSDLGSLATTARREGDAYVVDGAKTFITNGLNADLIITAVKTDPSLRHRGISLLVIERGTTGLRRSGPLHKLGLHAQDTAELSFADARVPVANLLGNEGAGYGQLVAMLAQERLSIAVAAVAASTAVLAETVQYVRDRSAFGVSIGSFQNTRFRLAELATEVDIAQHYLDACVLALGAGELSAVDAAKAKWWTTELQGRVCDTCVQLHGGYGYMAEHSVARAFADARVTRIYGGTTEIMKEIVGRSLDLG